MTPELKSIHKASPALQRPIYSCRYWLLIFQRKHFGSGIFLFVLALLAGCDRGKAETATPTRGMNLHQIRELGGSSVLAHPERTPIQFSTPQTPRITTNRTDTLGNPVTVSCASCHSNFTDRPLIETADQLRTFHVGLSFQHGPADHQLTCMTCHHAPNYNFLRLADGKPLEFGHSRQLCAQCHSIQDRDYEHGAHGGMNGYWDRTKGTQVRKTCIDCHDPHSPRLPQMLPTFKPLDRFLKTPESVKKH